MMQHLRLECAGRVATVIFDRPDQLNAMNRRMMDEITATFESLSQDDAVGAIVVTGSGKGFMAGADIKEYAAQTASEFDAFQTAGERMYASLEANSKPVIAAVNGYALGGGFEMVLACDVIVASDRAKFGLPEIKLGLVPGGGGTQRSVRKLGRNRANYMLLTGAIFPASEFVSCGFVQEITTPEALLPRTQELAAAISVQPPAAVEALKRLTALALLPDPAPGMAEERATVTSLYRSPEGAARIRSFAEHSAARTAAKTQGAT
jgi:enoyl-CoA hydratase/3-hydroxypropionyl-coenzyme A dehydratase